MTTRMLATMLPKLGFVGKLSWLLICSVVLMWYWLIDLFKAFLLSFDNFLTGTPRNCNRRTWRTGK